MFNPEAKLFNLAMKFVRGHRQAKLEKCLAFFEFDSRRSPAGQSKTVMKTTLTDVYR